MFLKSISLQNFRNYKKVSFDFTNTNIIIGKNTVGKTNILESIYFLSSGTSFRAEKDVDVIKLNEDFSRIEGIIEEDKDNIKLNVLLARKNGFSHKRYLINDIPKRQIEFALKMPTVLFTPEDIEIITDSPSSRRKYLNNVLNQTSKEYYHALSVYEKALKHRNKMLYFIKEGRKIPSAVEFEYWNNLLINNGKIITQYRQDFIEFLNQNKKNTFNFIVFYDKSTITQERIDKYFEIEQKTGVTLIGPQRDDLILNFPTSISNTPGVAERTPPGWKRTIKDFGSRGEQRLTILQMKLLEIEYLKQKTNQDPLLLLDDIFSELDNTNIEKILRLFGTCQIIITTTHKEFIPKKIVKNVNVIELKDD